jgi:hypothetical protein
MPLLLFKAPREGDFNKQKVRGSNQQKIPPDKLRGPPGRLLLSQESKDKNKENFIATYTAIQQTEAVDEPLQNLLTKVGSESLQRELLDHYSSVSKQTSLTTIQP